MFTADQQIGPYTLIRRIGRGGFGEVWLAERRSQFFSKKLAIKLPHDDQVDLKTIGMEAALWEQASGHPNVLPIIDADVYDGQIVIASEYADGGSLADRVKNHGRPVKEQSIKLVIGVLNGLEFLHERKIIHRDVKPQNILIQGDTPRLADFGISRAMQTTANSSIVAGTDAYMSPESFEGKRSPQTDIWSVGVLLFELINGSLPFPQEHPSERMYAILTREPLDLDSIQPSMLRAVIGKALEKDPAKRYATAREMRDHLEWVLKDLDERTSSTNDKTVVLDSHISQLTIETPRSHIAPDPILPTPLPDEAHVRSEIPEPAKPTQLVVPLFSRDDKPEFKRSSFLESYSDEPIEDDAEEDSSRWIFYAAAGVVVILILGLFQLLNFNNTSGAAGNDPRSATPKPTISTNPSPSPSLTATATPTATPISKSERNGRYKGPNGTIAITGADSNGFSFSMQVGTGSGGSGELDGKAKWIDETNAVHASIPDQENYDDPTSPWYRKKCTVRFKFSGSTVRSEEVSGCLFYHGAGATLSGTFSK